MVSAGTLTAVAVDCVAFDVVLALLGVSITLVIGLGEALTLAADSFAVIAVLIATAVTERGLGLPVGVLAGLVVVGAFGLVVDRTLFRSVYRSEGEERILLGIFLTLGLAVLLQGPVVIVAIEEVLATYASDWLTAIFGGLLIVLFLYFRRGIVTAFGDGLVDLGPGPGGGGPRGSPRAWNLDAQCDVGGLKTIPLPTSANARLDAVSRQMCSSERSLRLALP